MGLKDRLANVARRTPLLKKLISGPIPSNRSVFVGNKFREPRQDGTFQTDKFCDNKVITSKYTAWNFVPKNLFEQFRRIANFYFLCVSIVLLVIDSPVSPATNILPLVFVVVVTAVKQGYEDILRHTEDKAVNNHPTTALRGNELVTLKSQNVLVGDVIKVKADGVFPCDMVLLASTDAEGQCSVQTTNLDGETNLKVLECPLLTRETQALEQLSSVQLLIECEQPTANLYEFVGNIKLFKDSHESVNSLDSSNILLRGAKLKNTEFVYGCAIYTGRDTKMALNSQLKSAKRSRVERKMNVFLVVLVAVLLIEAGVCTALEYWWLDACWLLPPSLQQPITTNWSPWYIPLKPGTIVTSARNMVEGFLAFIVLFNYIIPISLYVTVEFQKFLGSVFFGWDLNMYDPITDHPAKVNTSDLNEELGQVSYLFCDKTGTLTENQMEFRQCCVGSSMYEDNDGQLRHLQTTDSKKKAAKTHLDLGKDLDLQGFLTSLAVCHTARAEPKQVDIGTSDASPSSSSSSYVYHASSPDEKALLEACQKYGVVYCGTTQNGGSGTSAVRHLLVMVNGEATTYRLLHVLEFDSDRKCMSVLVEDAEGICWLLCKGAESTVLRNCTTGPVDLVLKAVDCYARLGLRTLVIARRRLDTDEAAHISATLDSARTSMSDRARQQRDAYRAVEHNFEVLGATAVEDRLQDGVADTVEALRTAGVKVWILTGDKEETAVNVGYTAGLFNAKMELIRLVQLLSQHEAMAAIEGALARISAAEQDTTFGLVVDGDSLSSAMQGGGEPLLQVCQAVSSVLCCRMSPLQKAEVVKLVKNGPGKPVTAAIGDGANDVGMIQEAHVGVGIMGKEGRHAARCSDYALARFRFIRTALLVHGHLYYVRLCNLVQYSFYKNVAFITAQLYYSYLSAYSAQTVFDDYYLTFFNITFAFLPVLLYGLFEQPVKREQLEEDSKLYRTIKDNTLLSTANFVKWFVIGLWHSVVLFFFPYIHLAMGGGSGVSVSELGTIIVSICVLVVNFEILIMSYFWCAATAAGLAITFVGYLVMGFFYCNVVWSSTVISNRDMYAVMNIVFSSPTFYLLTAICIVASLLPDMLIRFYQDVKGAFLRRQTPNRQSQSSAVQEMKSSQCQLLTSTRLSSDIM